MYTSKPASTVYDTLLPAYVHVFQTVIPPNWLPRMFSMNQARYSTVIFLRGPCKFAISMTATTCQFSIENFPKTRHKFTTSPSKKSTHTREVYRKIIHRNWKFTHKKHIWQKLMMTSTSSKLLKILCPEDNNTKNHWAQDILFRLHEQSTTLSSTLYTS